MTAIGFIETWGLVPAIEAADAMLKAADVRLLERNQVGSGLVTITVAGTVSAVQASVDAAQAAVERIHGGVLVSRHVIARPDAEVAAVIRTVPAPEEACAEGPEPAVAKVVGKVAPEAAAKIERRSTSELKKMKVAELRKLARDLTGVEPSSGKKKELIDTIVNVYRKIEE
jgi:microcompartment protein CcmL/EutN